MMLPDGSRRYTLHPRPCHNVKGDVVTCRGVYDLLVLPPSFPYGGMENPCLTFVTPTVRTHCLLEMTFFVNFVAI